MNDIPFLTVAIAGKAGTGKTTATNLLTASTLTTRSNTKQSPEASMLSGVHAYEGTSEDDNVYGWDRTIFAAPLKEIIGIKETLSGPDMVDRRLYQIHNIVSALYNHSPIYGGPTYKKLVKLVRAIDDLPLGSYNDNYRTFQQSTADMIKANNEDAFANFVYQKAMSKISDINEDIEDFEDQGLQYHRILVVGDLRYDNEADMIANKLKGLIYELKASKKVRKERLEQRDGVAIAKENAKHSSEQRIDKSYIHMTIDTDDLLPSQVAGIIREDIYKQIG
jgi:hypothetical protein